jgi:hypothetical protein
MAHFAEINKDKIVTNVYVVANNVLMDNGVESEKKGIEFLQNLYNNPNVRYIQTSYNNNFRKSYAGIGYMYDDQVDVFIAPQPYPSWKLNYTTFEWESPVVKPDFIEGHIWIWSEINKEWISIEFPAGQ